MTGLPSSGPSAGSRRFWISILFFALVNVGVWVGYHRWLAAQQPRKDILVVQAFSPGDGEVVEGAVTLSWTFNLDVAKPGTVVKKGEGAPILPGTISPQVLGEWMWTDARTLTFEAQEKLPRATKFTATLNPAAFKSREGYTLAKAVTNTFSTTPLELVGVRQAAFDGEDRVLLEIEFNDKVIPGEVMQHLEIEGPDGKGVKAVLHGDGAGTIVRVLTERVGMTGVQGAPVPVLVVSRKHLAEPTLAAPEVRVANSRRTNPQKANTLWVTITPGLAGASGPVGISEAVSTEVEVANVLLADDVSANIGSEGPATLTLSFNSEIKAEDLEEIRGLISVEPAVSFTVVRRSWDGRKLELNGDFLPGTRYAVKIGKVEAGDDVRKYPRPALLSVFVPDREPAAFFEHEDGYLGSKGNRTILVKAVNVAGVRIRADRVYENNLVAWQNSSHRGYWGNTDRFAHPLAIRHFDVSSKKNQVQELRVDLDELLGKGAADDGVYSLTLAPDDQRDKDGDSIENDPERQMGFWRRAERLAYSSWDESSVVTLSDIGLTAKLMMGEKGTEQAVLVWAVSLSSGKAMEGVKVRVYSDRNQLLGEGVTGEDGLARVEHVNPALDEKASVVIAEGAGKSITWLNLSGGRRNESDFATKGRGYLRSGYEAFVWSERGVYRPGETVVLRAIVRGAQMSTPAEKMPLRWQIRRPDGRDWENTTVAVDADGGGEWRVSFPSDAQTGWWSVRVGLPGENGTGSAGMKVFGRADFQIEEFIPDRMKVGLKLGGPGLKDGAGRLELGKGPLLADVQGDYLFGQPAAGLQTQMSVRIWASNFSAAKYPAAEGWMVGDTVKAAEVLTGGQKAVGDHVDVPAQMLDKEGHTQFEIEVGKVLEKPEAGSQEPEEGEDEDLAVGEIYAFRGPWSLYVSASVVEIGGRAVSANEMIEADGLPYYLMVRQAGGAGYVEAGKAAKFETAFVSPGGQAADVNPRNVKVRAFRETWVSTFENKNGHYQYESSRKLEEVKGAKIKMQGGSWVWTPAATGGYVLEFSDRKTKQVATLRVYAGDRMGWNDNISRQNPERVEVELMGEKPEASSQKPEGKEAKFRVGEEMKVMVRSPFAGRLLLTMETDTVLVTKVVEMTGTVAEVMLTVPEGARPNGYVAATVVRAVDPSKEWRTHRGFGLARFKVDAWDRGLKVAIEAPKEIRPTRTLDVDVMVTDAKGEAVGNAAVALAAVDEGILSLTNYTTPGPLAYFNGTRGLGVETSDLYGDLMPEVAKADGASKVGGDGGGDEFERRHSSPVAAKRVRPVSLVSEIVHTDGAGKASVHLQVPEFLGQLRVMAVAYRGELVGSGAKGVLVRSPLVVQTSFPRFLAPGDSCEVPVLVINNSGAEGTVRLKMTTGDLSTKTRSDEDPRRIAGGILSFEKGEAEVGLGANEQKVVMFKMKAGDGVGVGAIAVEGTMGEEVFAEHLEVPVRAASPMVSRGGYLTATVGKDLEFEAGAGMLAGTGDLEVHVGQRPTLGISEGLAYLDHYPYGCVEQTTSTCFPLVYLSDIGKQIAPGVFEQERVSRKVQYGISRLMGMQTGSGGLSMWPGGTEEWDWGTVYAAHFLVEAEKAGYVVPEDFKTRLTAYLRSMLLKSPDGEAGVELHAYAAYVMALDGKADRAVMNRLGEILDSEEKLGRGQPSAKFYLALAWAAAGRKDLAEKMIPEQLPLPRTVREMGGNLGSGVRDQALLVTTLLTVSPEHAGLPGLVERLSEALRKQQWLSTQDNAALGVMAIGKYLRTVKDDKPFETAELWDGEKLLGGGQIQSSEFRMSDEGERKKLTVRVKGEAGAKAYVSWLQNGVPVEMPAAADHSLKVRREFLTENGEALDVTTLMSGTAVVVRVTVETTGALSNVVIEDLLPAGLEIENPRLATSAKKNSHDEDGMRVRRMDVRDDRMVVIGDLPTGVSTWSYLARAVTPGVYVVPPVRGECMYDPGINSISGGGGKMTVIGGQAKSIARRE